MYLLAGVKADKSPLPSGRQQCVIPYRTRVAVVAFCKLLYPANLFTYLLNAVSSADQRAEAFFQEIST